MGTYYKIVCPSRRECIEPGNILDEVNPDGGGVKDGPFILNHTMQIAACYAIRGAWVREPMVVDSDGSIMNSSRAHT